MFSFIFERNLVMEFLAETSRKPILNFRKIFYGSEKCSSIIYDTALLLGVRSFWQLTGKCKSEACAWKISTSVVLHLLSVSNPATVNAAMWMNISGLPSYSKSHHKNVTASVAFLTTCLSTFFTSKTCNIYGRVFCKASSFMILFIMQFVVLSLTDTCSLCTKLLYYITSNFTSNSSTEHFSLCTLHPECKKKYWLLLSICLF